ncbi:MAG: rhodanese-like domain-containing protein [Sphaerochaetaceae bacterium]
MKMNKKYIVLILTILLVTSTLLFAFGQNEVKETTVVEMAAEYHKIDAETAKEAFDTQTDITIVDVRTESEYNGGHVIDAINIPLDVIGKSAIEQFPNKNEKLYVYCRSGSRSAQAAKILVEMGYTNVYDFGGIINWPYGVEI